MLKVFKYNLKKITALLLAASMTMSFNSSAYAQDVVVQENITQEDITQEDITQEDIAQEDIVQEDIVPDETIMEEESLSDETLNADGTEEEAREKARERECMPNSPVFCYKLLKYLDIKYPEMDLNVPDSPSDDYNYYPYTEKMEQQVVCEEIVIDGDDPKVNAIDPDLSENMVQFKLLGCFGNSIGTDDNGQSIYNDKVKTLVIRNVDEIRNLYVPASVETLIIENTTFNCYQYPSDSPGFQSGMLPGDLKYCKNLKKLVLNNVKFGDNYKRGDAANLLPEYYCPYETNYVLNLQNCTNLEELVINVSFDGAEEVQLAIDGGSDNLFQSLTAEKCKINPAPGTGYGQVTLYANPNSNLSKYYNSSEAVEFKNKQFRLWLLEAVGVDSNNDGVISQEEMDAIDTLTINDQTAHFAKQTSLSAFHELADIGQMHGLKTLEIDFYDPNSYSDKGNRHPLEGIDFPDSLENLSMKNIYWEKNTQTKSHELADIVLTNLRTLELYNTDVCVGSGDSYFNHSTKIELTDTEGVLQSCLIERTDVESITLINNSNGCGIQYDDEKQRIRFSASDCRNLKSIEFLGEGYAVEGSVDLTNDAELTHIGVPNADKTQWTLYGEFDSTYAPVTVILNNCSKLGSYSDSDSDCKEIVIDYDFINGRNLNVQALVTNFSDDHKLTINRKPRIIGDVAGKVYLSCDSTGSNVWVYNHYKDKEGFEIENRSSFPTIAVFANGQRIRSSGEGNHDDESIFTKDTDCWVERTNLVMAPGGYSNNFGNLSFYVIDKVPDPYNPEASVDSLRKVFYEGDVYVEWEQQEQADSVITLPTQQDENTGGYKLTGTRLSSTGAPGEVLLKLYVYTEDGNKSYIGYSHIKIFKMPDSVELVNDGTIRGSGTKENPYIIGRNEELKLKARLLVDGEVDRSGDYALRDIYWRIKEYDETPKYTSDSDGYSLYTLDTATKAGISIARDKLDESETETSYDKKIDPETYYNHRRFLFDTAGSKFKIVAQMPYKNNDAVISTEVFAEFKDESFWCTNIEDQIYTGKAIKPQLNIYFDGIHLVEGKDYALSYSNNVKAASKTAVDKNGKCIGPSVTITGKGNYSGKQVYYFSILPRSIESAAKVDDLTVAKTGRSISIKPAVILDGKALKQGTDYVISTSVDEKDVIASYIAPGEYPLYVVGQGNYEGAVPFSFDITESVPASKVSFGKIANQNYQNGAEIGQLIKDSIKITYAKKDVTDCFDIKFDQDTEVGTATVIATAKKGVVGAAGYSFAGFKKTTFKILGLNIKDARLGENGKEKLPEFTYSGSECTPKPNLYDKTGTVPLVEDIDYSITYINNTNAGTATAVIDGKGQYTGTKNLTFKINKYDAGTDSERSIQIDSGFSISEPYAKGGAMPKRDVTRNGVLLIENKDYKLSYKNNTAVADLSSSKVPQIIVKFMGNYSGTKIVPFTIHTQYIDCGTITLADKPVSTKENAWKQTVATIVDLNDKKLVAGKDYSKDFEYFYDSMCSNPITEKIIPADTTIYVRINGINNYADSYIVGTYRVSTTNIATAKATIDNQIFTGKEICPTANQITVTTGTKKNPAPPLTPGVDYEVVPGSYQKNISKGTASVTILGKGEYFGTKVVKFNIVVNKISWWIW